MAQIIDHTHPVYRSRWGGLGTGRFNGAYYYSREIVKNIIPLVETDRPWVTVNLYGPCFDRAIFFIHNNLHPSNYDWLMQYKDLVLVCGIPETVPKVEHLGTAIYLPLSIDVDYVKQFRTEKTREAAFVGRRAKRNGLILPEGIDYIEGLKRNDLLREMAKYKTVYAVGRTAIEAKALGCKLKPYDPRFPDVRRWKVLDNRDAAKMLQEELNRIDH